MDTEINNFYMIIISCIVIIIIIGVLKYNNVFDDDDDDDDDDVKTKPVEKTEKTKKTKKTEKTEKIISEIILRNGLPRPVGFNNTLYNVNNTNERCTFGFHKKPHTSNNYNIIGFPTTNSGQFNRNTIPQCIR